jgi:hypothetical protein
MRRSFTRLVSPIVAAAILASCTDNGPTGNSPAGIGRPATPSASVIPGECTTYSNLITLVNTVFGTGSPDANSVLGKLDNLDKQLKKGNIDGAQDQARNIVSFIQQKAVQGGLPGTPTQVQMLITAVLCYAGLSPDAFLVYPSDSPQVLLNSAGNAGVSLQGNTVTEPTLITITLLSPDSSPLDTKLDTYPGYVLLTQSSALTKPAVVGVCPASGIPADVLARLRLGHQASTGFQITPAADASFLDCSTSVAQSRMPGWLAALVSFVTPKPLYAKLAGGGIGGLATEFSPFGPVDTELSFSGGIGGTATEFQLSPLGDSLAVPSAPSASKNTQQFSLMPGAGGRVSTVVAGTCVQADGQVGAAVEVECRPGVTLTTAQGTVMQNVPVGWAIALGGGTAAPETPVTRDCGVFGATAATTTNVNGKAGVCWNLGPVPGTNTVVATPTAGGDAPVGVTFSPANITFTATALTITPTAAATGGTFVFDGSGHAGSGSCSNGLTPALSYSGSSTTPTNVGVYTLIVTCGAGDPLFTVATQTAQITITPAPTNATAACPASVPFTGSPLTPCSATVTGPGLSLAPTPTYTSNVDVGTATASVSYAGGGNYQASNGSATFQITTAATVASVSCPAVVTYTGFPLTPCTGRVSGPGLLLAVTPTYTSNVVGTATASVNYVGGGNYGASSASTTFQIRYVQSGCFASPIYSVMPPTKSAQQKGSNVPIKCTLVTAQGTAVTNATGDLLVQDMGTNGMGIPITAFAQSNVFSVSQSGNYSYGLDTSPAAFIPTHYFLVTATWTDGSKTTGWFYVK